MKIINTKILISAAVVALMFVGCKPTEKNYKSAYDAALAKREAAAAEQMRPATGLLSDDGPQMRVINGDTIFVQLMRMRADDGSRLPGSWGVAVSRYKMNTNAKASAEDIRAKGYPRAFTGKAEGGYHYVLVDYTSNLDSVRVMAREFQKKFPKFQYVGLPGAPVLISY